MIDFGNGIHEAKIYGGLRFAAQMQISPAYQFICYDGFVRKKDEFSVNASEEDGEFYVYLWKHLRGNVFYVGSGKNDRWTQKFRGDSFWKELDHGDAVVYKVVHGLSMKTARLLERYVTWAFRLAGCELVNGDNNDATQEKFDALVESNPQLCGIIGRIDRALISIAFDDNFSYSDAMQMLIFKENYGSHYFTEQYAYRRVGECHS